MNKLYSLIIICCYFLISSLEVSAQHTLTSSLETLSTYLLEIPSKSSTYNQKLTWDATTPYQITYTQEETTKKGKSEEWEYMFNLKDIDVNSIVIDNKKELMFISFFFKNKQSLVKVFKNNEQQKYISKLEFLASDKDNARQIKATLQEACDLAKKIPSDCTPATLDEQLTWLSDHITNFQVNDVSYSSKFVRKEGSLIEYSFSKSGKKSVVKDFTFNLVDLAPNKVNLKVQDKLISIVVTTRNSLKYIAQTEEDKAPKYINKLQIYVNDFDVAKCMLSILSDAIKESRQSYKSAFTSPTSFAQSTELLLSHIKSTAKTQQKLSGDLVSTLTQEVSKKDDITTHEYIFNWADIQSKSAEIQVSGSAITIHISTIKKLKLIQPFKDGEVQNYAKQLSFVATDIENAKQLVHYINTTIDLAKDNNKIDTNGDVSANFSWIKTQLEEKNKNIETEQALALVDANNCKWQFKTIKAGKKQQEELYEFTLSDINPQGIDFKISGKKLFVEVKTVKKDKSIKYYKNGEPGDYKNELLLELDNIEVARKIIALFKESVELCE